MKRMKQHILPIDVEMFLKTDKEILSNFDNEPDCTTDTTGQALDSYLQILEEARQMSIGLK